MDEQPTVTRKGALDMQVCVPAEWTDEQVKNFADTNNPSGLLAGWAIRKEGDELLDGKPERVACSERSGYVHIMLDC